MKGINILRKETNTLESRIEDQKVEDIVEIFIESLYEPTIKENSYQIKDNKSMNLNSKKFMNTCRKWVKKYANNIKRNYKEKSIKSDKYLLDNGNEEANIYLYIVESLHYFFKNYCNEDIELFKSYIEDSYKTYVNTENKEYTFNKFMYMSVERKIKEENKLYEKSLEKGNMNLNGVFARIDLDATLKNEDGKEQDIELYSMGLFTLLREEDSKTEKEILEDNIKEMTRVQNKLSTVLTKAQVKFIVTEMYGCYYDIDKEDFIKKIYTKQQRNQFLNQISKRVNRDIKPFFIKKHNGKYEDDTIKYRKKNKKVLYVEPREEKTEYIGKHTTLRTEGSIKIKEVEGGVTEYIPFGATKRIVNKDGVIEYA